MDQIEEIQTASFAAGCFWGIEQTFRDIPGVIETSVGYASGQIKNPTYSLVSTGKTGHAETVQLKFDPDQVSYQQLLDKFWKIHNPTSLNGQGPDVGSQYRSIIFYHNDQQKELAESTKIQLDKTGHYDKPIVTEIVKAGDFYRAEEYHQQYYEKKGIKGCSI
ncbi:MAG: peptide-methionine (S)-S-oxide reductase MsrA [Patescibacteria group bacterium]